MLLTITIPLGSVVWGGAGIGSTAALALAAAAVAGLVLWLVRRGLAG